MLHIYIYIYIYDISLLRVKKQRLARIRCFIYLVWISPLPNQNPAQEEFKSGTKSGNAGYHSVQNLLSSSLLSKYFKINPLNAELNPICYLLALLGAHHFLHVSRIRVKLLTLRLLISYIYMEHLFLMFLAHTQRRSTVGRTPLDE